MITEIASFIDPSMMSWRILISELRKDIRMWSPEYQIKDLSLLKYFL